MRIWIDITNTPHVNLIMPLINYLSSLHELIISARDFSETLPLLRKNGIEPLIIGKYKGKSKIYKTLGFATRSYQLLRTLPSFDISLSLGGNYTASISWLRKKPSIIVSDNDISFKTPAYKFGTHFIFPSYFDFDKVIRRFNIERSRINIFKGFKEDIYIADYVPDPNFLDLLPFKDFITIRPENLKASYIPSDSKTIVPSLFEKFKEFNILFLPRYEEEKDYSNGFLNIFIPSGPLNGLDVCYYSQAMLTGAGTFAREAALLGTPAVSFFPGKVFLKVDKIMQEKGWQFKSRNPDEICDYVMSSKKNVIDLTRSRHVQEDFFQIIRNIINQYI